MPTHGSWQTGYSPRESILIWLAGLMLGIGAGVVLIYHLLHASRAGAFPKYHRISANVQPNVISEAHRKALQAARLGVPPERLGRDASRLVDETRE